MASARPWKPPLGRGWSPVEPPRRPVLFLNRSSGGGKAERAGLADRARERGIETIELDWATSVETLVAEQVALGADVIGVAGGDGSLGVVAAAARAHDIPFVCIPAGTRNHFALDVGVDRSDLVGALDAFTEGVERSIDVAEVNGRLMLNNVSLGIYGDAVQRPRYRGAKARTLIETAHEVLGPSGTATGLTVVDDRGRTHLDPAVVLISNNPYALERPLVTGSRPSLDSGRLGIVVLDRPGVDRAKPGRAWTATSIVLDSSETVPAGLDGEAVRLDSPIEVVIVPAALRVRISPRHPGTSPAGLLSPRDR